jgi:hypothetical protein
MNKVVENLKKTIAKDNPIFGDNAFYFKNYTEFRNGGVSDQYSNLFYIRPISNGVNKFKISGKNPYNIYTEKANFRIVFQLTGFLKEERALEILRNQLLANEDVTVFNYSDETEQIYKAEYGKEKSFNSGAFLLSFDIEISSELGAFNCECLTASMC